MQKTMLAAVYHGLGDLRLEERPVPVLKEPGDAIVKVTLSTICTSDLHILNGAVPRAVPGTVLGHEFVGEIVSVGEGVKAQVGERVAANCITFAGTVGFAAKGGQQLYAWRLGTGCRSTLLEYVRVPYADTGYPIPDHVTDDNALFLVYSIQRVFRRGAGGNRRGYGRQIGAGPVGLCAPCAGLFGAGMSSYWILTRTGWSLQSGWGSLHIRSILPQNPQRRRCAL
ncbi:MAG: alcohol dehydrogenase catalytic domain-containing protein [Anaeromassilibacillus sp.]